MIEKIKLWYSISFVGNRTIMKFLIIVLILALAALCLNIGAFISQINKVKNSKISTTNTFTSTQPQSAIFLTFSSYGRLNYGYPNNWHEDSYTLSNNGLMKIYRQTASPKDYFPIMILQIANIYSYPQTASLSAYLAGVYNLTNQKYTSKNKIKGYLLSGPENKLIVDGKKVMKNFFIFSHADSIYILSYAYEIGVKDIYSNQNYFFSIIDSLNI